ncbi:MAG: DUF2249 domain-containing protein [Halieaceae bacterium]|nr:DUF2249 domain-containing protein [Halieaceae bacterium]
MEYLLDVSELEPPEPLEQIVNALERMPRGDHLRVLHRREPFPLYDILREMKCRWVTRPGEVSDYEMLIWHASDEVPGEAEC